MWHHAISRAAGGPGRLVTESTCPRGPRERMTVECLLRALYMRLASRGTIPVAGRSLWRFTQDVARLHPLPRCAETFPSKSSPLNVRSTFALRLQFAVDHMPRHLAANARDISAVSAGRHLLLGRSSVRVNAPPSPLSFLVCPRRGRRPSRDGSRSPPPSHAERGDGWNDTLEESFRPRRRSARIQTQARVSCTASPSGREAPASFP